ncbi:flagellar hook-length control protein FliK [Pontibacter sp. JAM-7]|uniref:flagellar hook-length control protein FliK n=1 Tax=Pontibacter sp. JAM-7 TaxID=3366581 RepID=UPI003AF8CF28
MNQQVSLPALGGLLSLDLSMLSQSQSGGAAATDLVTGFGALLNQMVAEGQLPATLVNGEMLPQGGAGLPLSELPQPELLQQQLEQLALLLEQQGAKGADELAGLAAEISRLLQQTTAPALDQAADAVPSLPELPDVAGQPAAAVLRDDLVTPAAGALRDAAARPDSEAQLPGTPEVPAPVVVAEPEVLTPIMGSEQPEGSSERPNVLLTAESQTSVPPEGDDQQVLNNAAQSGADTAPEVVPQSPLPGNAQAVADDAEAEPPITRERPSQAPLHASEQAVAALTTKANEQAALHSAVLAAGREAAAQPQVSAQASELVKGQVRESGVTQIVGEQVVTGRQEGDANSRVSANTVSSDLPVLPTLGKKLELNLENSQALLRSVAAMKQAADTATSQQRTEAGSVVAVDTYTSAGLGQPTQTQKTLTESHTLMMPNQMRMNTPAWQNALGERAMLLVANGARTAEIRLDPPELGALQIRVQMNQDQVSLSFSSPHAHVRDAVEQSLPRLREMFAEQGLALQDSSVSDQSSGESRGEAAQQLAEQSYAGADSGSQDGDELADVPLQAARNVSLVDYYA